jgi:chitinase
MPCTPACSDTSAIVIAQNSNNYYYSPDDNVLTDQTCTGGFQAYCCIGFVPSTKINTGNLFLFGQGGLTKRGVTERGLTKRGARQGAAAGLTTVVACAAAFSLLIATAPVTFGLSLLGEPVIISACLAAGIVMTATGFAAKPGGTTPQTNPKPPPPQASPRTGVPVTTGKTTVGNWQKLDFGTVAQTKDCDCFVTYTCRYGKGFDEVCDNQRWGIDQLLHGNTVYHVNPGGRNAGGGRRKEKWTKERIGEFRTLVQGADREEGEKARCEVDEFPQGDLKESTNNQVLRLPCEAVLLLPSSY